MGFNGSSAAPDGAVLDITRSSIGVDAAGMTALVGAIQVELIADSAKEVNNGIDQLIANVDTYWKGAAAEAFKNKCLSEKTKLLAILGVLDAKLVKDLSTMVANTKTADDAAAEQIIGLGN